MERRVPQLFLVSALFRFYNYFIWSVSEERTNCIFELLDYITLEQSAKKVFPPKYS